jgi:DNA (cytosine-5)-methyltransferase 1
MTNKTFASLFTGGGLADIGAQAAEFTSAWGIEIDPRIAAVATLNGVACRVMDVLKARPIDFETVDWLHASPPCVRASVANTSAKLNAEGTKETRLDVELAEKVAHFIRTLKPQYVSIENVRGYLNFKGCMKAIKSAFQYEGYGVVEQVINSADFGVPQSRVRLLIRAVRGVTNREVPPLKPTHAAKAQRFIDGTELRRWVGWYEAIEDILHTLPDSALSPWQSRRLLTMNSFLAQTEDALGKDAMVIESNTPFKAFAVDCFTKFSNKDEIALRADGASMFTICASQAHKPFLALLISGENAGQEWGGWKTDEKTAMTLSRNTDPRALLIQQGRVVKMTPRALARFQSVPNDYILPPSKALASKIIGNGVPPLLMQRIGEAWR